MRREIKLAAVGEFADEFRISRVGTAKEIKIKNKDVAMIFSPDSRVQIILPENVEDSDWVQAILALGSLLAKGDIRLLRLINKKLREMWVLYDEIKTVTKQ